MRISTDSRRVLNSSLLLAAGLGLACNAPWRSRSPEALYQRYCADCHGPEGEGNGRYADQFATPPASLRNSVYKFKRTASGELPTEEDIFRTLSIGARGTAMVPQLQLSESERLAMVDYLKSLSPAFARRESPEPLDLPRPPAGAAENLALGEEWYFKAGCQKCHGTGGRGDGEAARTLEDRWGRPVRVPDLTLVPYKQGESPEDIAWVIWTGRDGTPMPSYQGALLPGELWAMAGYVASLQDGRKPAGMMGLIGEEVLAMRIDMEAVHAWRMGRMPMGRGRMRNR